MAFKITQATRCSTQHRDRPKRAVERRPQGRVHQQHGIIWRYIENISEAGIDKGGCYWQDLATGHGGLRKERLALDEVETRAVGNDAGLGQIRVGELDG